MIIQTGLRTDIPAFYSQWFVNRLKAGYVLVRNPYRPDMVTRYNLSPDVVDAIGFCTKNPAPMLSHMDALQGYGQYWYVTITPYGRDLEPNVPPKDRVMEDFRRLSRVVGIDRIGWRYDPILIWGEYSLERHLADFRDMAQNLAGYTKTCVISFLDLYQKVRRNFPEAREVSGKDQIAIGTEFARIGKKYGMEIKSCGEGRTLEPYGVNCGGCMTLATYERAIGERLDAPKSKSKARSACACHLSCDIGQYDTCAHLCRYCYANANAASVRRNMQLHDPDSPFLVGGLRTEDRVHEAKQANWRDGQISFESFQLYGGTGEKER